METSDSTQAEPRRSPSVPAHLVPGEIVAGKYELLRRLGVGAMGEVWAARHRSLDEEVAIKLVLRGVDHEDGTSAESRFLLEARVAASLSRKTRHIVAVTDHGHDGGLGYLVMELLAGEPLDQRLLRTGPMTVEEVAPLVSQIARALATAHAEGVVHRDLKPSNVFVTADEEGRPLAKVLDFGIAKLRRTSDMRAAHTTQRGFLLGTPAYMSPEQARGKVIDPRVDVWALAVIAYHLLTGEFPFDGETGEDLFARLCRVEPIALSERLPHAPAVVNDFFARAFATRIEDRFQSAAALAASFAQLTALGGADRRSSPPPPPSPRALVGRDESMIAAGVPRNGGSWRAVGAASLVVAVLVATALLLAVYFEREPTLTQPVARAPIATSEPPSARDVPTAEPASPPLARSPVASTVVVVSSTTPAGLPPARPAAPRGAATLPAAPASSGTTAPPVVEKRPPVDKSEVF